MQNKSGRDKRFVCSKLPWIIAAIALLVYLLTLNRWISFNNLDSVSRSSGRMWGPELLNPLYFLLTLPFRWLPINWIPLAYNLFSTVCAVATLGILARSVTLLPHDRTEAQRVREHSRSARLSIKSAWVPPVLAAIVCGLQLTFWEKGTTGSAEMLDMLLIAYIILCLLEFRISEKELWLWQAAFICGIAIANSWLMFCLFPFFLISLVWIKRLSFFNLRFLFRIFICCIIGLLLYLLLPSIHVLSKTQVYSFWDGLKINLSMDKNAFMYFAKRTRPSVLMMLGVTSFLPVLVMGIRWASNFGDPSRMGSALARWIFHSAHCALIAACIWVAFDPDFSPRYRGYPMPIFYYLSALSVGYFSGYFLLVFNPLPSRMGRSSDLQIWLDRFSQAAIFTLLVVVPISLVYRNLPQIRMTNGPAVHDYASALVRNLPEQAVILSDDSRKLALAQGALAKQGRENYYVFLDTQSLPALPYHVYQRTRYPDDWPPTINSRRTNQVDALTLIGLVATLGQKRPVYYLHPSFGYYFEYFDQRPRGLIFELVPHTTNSLSGAALSEAEVAQSRETWDTARPAYEQLIPFAAPAAFNTNILTQTLLDMFKISFQPNVTAAILGKFYSLSLNSWGVYEQRANQLDNAKQFFRDALDLNPENVAARENLDLNLELHAGRKQTVRLPKSLDEELGIYRGWEQALSEVGPFDDPTHCFGLGVTFGYGNLFRQAAQQLERVHQLVPDNFLVRLWLARLYTFNRFPDKAINLLYGVNIPEEALLKTGLQKTDFLQAQAAALFYARRVEDGERLLQDAMRNEPANTNLLTMVVRISTTFNRLTNAITAMDRLLDLTPDNVNVLMAKGTICVQAGRHAEAIPSLTRVLNLQTNNHNAKLLRALAYLNTDQFFLAQMDYDDLLKVFPGSNEVNLGLGELAWKKKDTNSAIHYYSICLTNVPPDSPPAKFLRDRLQSLQPESR